MSSTHISVFRNGCIHANGGQMSGTGTGQVMGCPNSCRSVCGSLFVHSSTIFNIIHHILISFQHIPSYCNIFHIIVKPVFPPSWQIKSHGLMFISETHSTDLSDITGQARMASWRLRTFPTAVVMRLDPQKIMLPEWDGIPDLGRCSRVFWLEKLP